MTAPATEPQVHVVWAKCQFCGAEGAPKIWVDANRVLVSGNIVPVRVLRAGMTCSDCHRTSAMLMVTEPVS